MRSLACFPLVLAAACGGLAPADAVADDLSSSAPRATVVLIHGLGGFQHLEQIDYFYGVPELYRSLGAAVVIPGSSMFNTIEHRAAELKAQLDPVPGPLILVAHSQGGLDARYLVSRLGYGYADRVKAVVTIATPHHGTPLADVVAGLVPSPVAMAVDELVKPLGWSVDEVYEMTTRNMNERFNREVPDVPSVTYWSYSGQATPFGLGRRNGTLHASLVPGWTLIDAFRLANDGVVPEASAHWGDFQGTLTADHFTEVNQPVGLHFGFDAIGFYRSLLRRFHDQGW